MNTKRTGIMLLILLSLSGCAAPEQEESTYIAESSDHKDDFGSGEEQDENEDYELKNIKMKPEEVEELSKPVLEVAEKCQAAYRKAGKNDASDIALQEETVHQMIEDAAKGGLSITCGGTDYNMQNYEKVDQALNKAKKGKNAETEFYEINNSGILRYIRLQFKKQKLYVTSVSAILNDNAKVQIQQVEKIQAYDWEYTQKGWLIWEKALSRNQEMDMHVFYRVLPLDAKCRELGNKCIMPVSYFCNNLFLTDWDVNSMGNLEFNDLYEFLYQMKYGEKMDEELYEGGIPKIEFEEVVQSFFDISTEQLETFARYDKERGVYPWEPIKYWNHISQFQPFPEVVNYIENEDGSLTLLVEAVFTEGGKDCSFKHEVTIKEQGEGWIYLGNMTEKDESYRILQYRPRRAFYNTNKERTDLDQ